MSADFSPSEALVEDILAGRVAMRDVTISSEALLRQAQIAHQVGRAELAANFERAAELVSVPDDEIFRIYEMLRPGRCGSKAELLAAARHLREQHGAARLAAFVMEAAEEYERRSLFAKRF